MQSVRIADSPSTRTQELIEWHTHTWRRWIDQSIEIIACGIICAVFTDARTFFPCLWKNRWICALFSGDFPRWRQCPHLLLGLFSSSLGFKISFTSGCAVVKVSSCAWLCILNVPAGCIGYFCMSKMGFFPPIRFFSTFYIIILRFDDRHENSMENIAI